MSKDRRRAVLAGLLALPFLAAAGAAGASDAQSTATVGVGIDHTPHVRVVATRSIWLGAAEALDSLKRPVAQRLVPPAAPQQATAISSLRGLSLDWLDADALVHPGPVAAAASTALRPKDRPLPYIRFSEGEQVFGFSFKIQPPPQVPELPSPRS